MFKLSEFMRSASQMKNPRPRWLDFDFDELGELGRGNARNGAKA
jgi:hypothetical protein